MKHVVSAWRRLLSPERFTVFVMMLIIWAGVAGALFAGISTDMRNREYLRGRAQTIADALATDDIKGLRGTKDDKASLAYENLRNNLARIRSNNRDFQSVYLLGVRDGNTLFVYVDSEPDNDQRHTIPGQAYIRPNSIAASAFGSSDSVIQGPVRDSNGTWLSAYAPVNDPVTQKTIAVVGVDSSALSYYGQIALYALVPLLLIAIPVAGLMRDIKLRNKQEELLALKNQFVSISSHELRSPLTGMMWAIQSLSRSGASRLNLEQLSMLGAMYHSVESSLATVNEILDFSIFDRGQAKIQHELTDVSAVIKQVVATLTLSARQKRLIIEPVGAWPRRVYTHGDVAALKRAFMNVFSNAIKYSKDATTIEITHQLGAKEHIIGVTDRGIGIPPTEMPKVLGGYYRATNATAVEVHGTGLGLLVTKKIIEQHGGKLWLESKLGEGTTVYISLPIAEEVNEVQGQPTAPTNQAPTAPVGSIPRDPGSTSTDTPSPLPPAHD